jgi:hypothetical protein
MWIYLLVMAALGVIVFASYQTYKAGLHPRRREDQQAGMGAIRFNGRNGRNMKIVRSDDGSFRVIEETNAGN